MTEKETLLHVAEECDRRANKDHNGPERWSGYIEATWAYEDLAKWLRQRVKHLGSLGTLAEDQG